MSDRWTPSGAELATHLERLMDRLTKRGRRNPELAEAIRRTESALSSGRRRRYRLLRAARLWGDLNLPVDSDTVQIGLDVAEADGMIRRVREKPSP